MQINKFSIFKAKEKKSDKSPDYRLSTKIGDEFVEIGGGWIKESKAGKFISCKLSEPYGARNGYHIEVDPADVTIVPKFDRDSQGNEIKTPKGYPDSFTSAKEEEINPEDIPF